MTQHNETSNEQPQPDAEWAIVELMGHTRMVGKISETTRFGVALGRCDIPDADGVTFTTCLFRGDAIYRVTFVDEATARRAANPVPARGYQAPALRAGDDADYEDDENDFDSRDPFGNESCE